MVAPGIRYELDGAREAINALQRLERVSSNPQRALNAIGAAMVTSTQRNIERERSPDGTPWPPLSPRTAEKRVGRGRRGFDHMLRVKLRLYSSISYLVGGFGVSWGSNVEYAGIHQLGGVIEMPARSGTVSIRRVKRKGGGIRARFAGSGSRGAEDRAVSIRAHQVRIPARPYLGISAADQATISDIVADELRREAGQ
jgi:phage virion morphogenesis protein